MNYEEQVSRNLDLAGRYLAYLVDRPGQLTGIADGATLALTDSDDPVLSRANEELAQQLIEQGAAQVEVRDVPAPATR